MSPEVFKLTSVSFKTPNDELALAKKRKKQYLQNL